MAVTAIEDEVTFSGEIHPAAEAWPLLPDDELAELAASIATIGLTDPITLDPAGRLLDGRNRLNACTAAGVDPEFVVYDGDPVPFIIAKNADRRHMSTGARAMATATVLAEAGFRKNGRWQRGSVSANGDISNSAWQKAMKEAGQVLDNVPKLAPKVIAGDVTLAQARKEAEQVAARSESETERMQTLKSEAPDLAAKVKAGELTLTEAEAAHRQRVADHEADVKRHAGYLTEAVKNWTTLLSVAEGTFAHFDEAVAQLADNFRDRLDEAVTVIKKGTK